MHGEDRPAHALDVDLQLQAVAGEAVGGTARRGGESVVAVGDERDDGVSREHRDVDEARVVSLAHDRRPVAEVGKLLAAQRLDNSLVLDFLQHHHVGVERAQGRPHGAPFLGELGRGENGVVAGVVDGVEEVPHVPGGDGDLADDRRRRRIGSAPRPAGREDREGDGDEEEGASGRLHGRPCCNNRATGTS